MNLQQLTQQVAKDSAISYDTARNLIKALMQVDCPEDELAQMANECAPFIKGGMSPNNAVKALISQKTAASSSQQSSSSLIEFSQEEAAELIAIGEEKGAGAHALMNAAFLRTVAGKSDNPEIQGRINQSRQSVVAALRGAREEISLASASTLGKVLWGQQTQNYLPSASSVVNVEPKSEN